MIKGFVKFAGVLTLEFAGVCLFAAFWLAGEWHPALGRPVPAPSPATMWSQPPAWESSPQIKQPVFIPPATVQPWITQRPPMFSSHAPVGAVEMDEPSDNPRWQGSEATVPVTMADTGRSFPAAVILAASGGRGLQAADGR
jgi:hypothetical protein